MEQSDKMTTKKINNVITNYSFSLLVEGVTSVPVRAVKGFKREVEFDTIQEGGLNDYVHLRRKAITKPFTFQIERYADTSLALETLPVGYEAILPMLLMVYDGRNVRSNVPIRTYAFTGATVMAKEYGELNAEKSGLHTETVTIAYRELICVNSEIDKFF